MRKPGTWELAVRSALALTVGAVALCAVSSTLATIQAKVDSGRAHAMAPGNGTIAAEYAAQLLAEQSSSGADSAARRMAVRALRQDATAVDALSVLGLQAQVDGDLDHAAAVFDFMHRLSRRELQAHISSIEMAVNAGDIAKALRHYDLALRTSGDAKGVLFPVLGVAIAEPKVRKELLPIIAGMPNWSSDFLGYVATSGVSPKTAIRLFAELENLQMVVPEPLRAGLVRSLLAEGLPDEAWRVYTQLRKDARRNALRDPEFKIDVSNATPFDWNTEINGTSYATIVSDSGDGVLEFALPRGEGGIIARQMQNLTSGQYAIAGQAAGVEGPERSRPYWQVSCSDGRELARIALPSTASGDGRFSGRFAVPGSCSTQLLSLVARPSDQLDAQSGRIERITVSPLDGGTT